MARSESRTKTAIWSDDDFRKLSAVAQRTYWMIYSQPTINLCGLVALTVRRWASYASDTTPESITETLAELEQAGFILVDVHTEEVLVRSFAFHDGVGKSEKTLGAAYRQLDSIASGRLRDAARNSLDALSDTPSQPRKSVDNQPVDTLSDTPPDRFRVRARAVSSLQSPSPVSCLQSPAGDGTGASHRGRLAAMRDLAGRVADVCSGDNRPAVTAEALELVIWACEQVDVRLVEEALGWARSLETPPVLPRALAKVVTDKARDSSLALSPFRPRRGLCTPAGGPQTS